MDNKQYGIFAMVVSATENIKQGKGVGVWGPLWRMCVVVTVLHHRVRLEFSNQMSKGSEGGSHVYFWWKRFRHTESLRWHNGCHVEAVKWVRGCGKR